MTERARANRNRSGLRLRRPPSRSALEPRCSRPPSSTSPPAHQPTRVAESPEASPEQPVLASRPVYQYLAHRTGLSLASLHWEPEVLPDDLQWRKLATLHASHPAKWMLWEGEPLPEVVDRLQTIGVECVVFDPRGNTPGKGTDFLGVMHANTKALETVFGQE